MGDFLGYVAEKLGDAVNGVVQVIVSFLNVVIEALPNPDPFPEIIQGMDVSDASGLGFGFYWIDAFFGVDTCTGLIAAWCGLMIASAIFAAVYYAVKQIH